MQTYTMISPNIVNKSMPMLLLAAAVSTNLPGPITSSAGVKIGQGALPDKRSGSSANLNTSDTVHEAAIAPLKDEIRSFATLPDDWDGPDSIKPSSSAVSAALHFVDTLSSQAVLPTVTAAGDGEISIFWRDDETFVDVSFYDDRATVFAKVGADVRKVRGITSFYELPGIATDRLMES